MYPGNSRVLSKNDFYSDSSDVDMNLTSEKQVSYSKNLSSQEDKISLPNQSLISVEKNLDTFSNTSQQSFPVKRVFLDSSSDSDIELPSLDLLHPAVVKQLTDKKKTTARKRKASTVDVEINNEKLKKTDEKQKKLREKEERQLQKKAQKKLKEESKKQLEYEKYKKRVLQNEIRCQKPGECLKRMTVVLDAGLLTLPCGAATAQRLQQADVRYEVEQQPERHMITFWRGTTVTTEIEPRKLETSNKEVLQDEVLLYIPNLEFVSMVDTFHKEKQGHGCQPSDVGLEKFIQTKKLKISGRNLTVLVQGVEVYLRQQKTNEKRSYRNQIANEVTKNKKKQAENSINVSHLMIEEACLSIQLKYNVHVKFVETDNDFANIVLQYVKSIAETPFKRDLVNRMNTGNSGAFVEGCRAGCKTGPDGQGLTRVWREQLQQFKNVSVDVANAIAEKYPAPRQLIEAYQSCSSKEEAERLLEDIVVRRGQTP